MAKVLYHQEAGDIEMDAQADTYTDPTNPDAGSEPSVSLFRNGKKVVTRAIQGAGIGQYSPFDPAAALKAAPVTDAAAAAAAELERLTAENAALKAEVEAAKAAAAKTPAAAAAAQKGTK